MSEHFTTYWGEEPVDIGVEPKEIRIADSVPAPPPRAEPAKAAAAVRKLVNDARNSRLATSLNPAKDEAPEWKIKWSLDVPDPLRPQGLLWSGDRILVFGERWQLADREGLLVASGPLPFCEPALDLSRAAFWGTNQFGLLQARRLSDGEPLAAVSLHGSKNFDRRFVAVRGKVLLAVSVELIEDLHGPPPEQTMIETTELEEPLKSWDEEGGPVVAHDLIRKTNRILAAAAGDTINVVTDDWLYALDFELNVKRALTGTFVPIEMSLDELGRIYLLVDRKDRLDLWLLTPDGERQYAFSMPAGVREIRQAPIVGYDHRVYLLSGSQIFALGADGKLEWSRQATGQLAGGVVTADDYLVTGEGSQIAAWNALGERLTLHSFPGEEVQAAPILTDKGELLVATKLKLYCLTPR